jgi:spermidine synthase
MSTFYLFSALVVATCGLVYELVAGTLASYLLGDSVTQFSTIIGAYLFAMGIGSWLSRYVHTQLLETFVRVEIIVGAVGGASAALLFLLFSEVQHFRVALYSIVGLIGTLVGLEIPLLLRILEKEFELRDLVSRVFAADYVGALLASLLFPLLLVPHLGLIRTSFVFGIFNVIVALILLFKQPRLRNISAHRIGAVITLLLLCVGFAYGDQLMALGEQSLYPGKAIVSRSTPYQRLVITRQGDDIRLFLNGNLQFSSRDEYRYHEALVHPVMAALHQPKHILILGGGDGLAAREILKYPSVEDITLVDLDPEMTGLFSQTPVLQQLNGHSLNSEKLHVVHADAFVWLRQAAIRMNADQYDAIFVDFPDPSSYSIGKLYSQTFYSHLNEVLAADGLAVIQSTSPYVAPRAFWCVDHTLQAAGLQTAAYHAFVPSFGEWGFVIAGHTPYRIPDQLPSDLHFVTPQVLQQLFAFPQDMARVATEVNRLDNQVLVHYFEAEWSKYLAE